MSERTNRSFALALCLIACGGETSLTEREGGAPIDPPHRTAAQNDALRAMAMDIAQMQACPNLVDRFLPLPEDRQAGFARGELPTVEGRLWVDECTVEREGEQLAMRVEGRGWQWISRSASGPFGSSFSVRGHVRFTASAGMDADVDLGYDTEHHRARVVLSPHGQPRGRLTPIGSLPIVAGGGWSDVVGTFGSMLGTDVQASARPMVEADGAAMIRRHLSGGATFMLDLCTGQLDGALGALGDGEAPGARPYADGEPWIDNMRVRLRPGGLDLSGPWAAQGSRVLFDVEVEEGEGAEIVIVCQEAAERIATEFLDGRRVQVQSPVAHRNASRGRNLELAVAPDACPSPVLVVMPRGNQPVLYRYRVRREGAENEAIVRCEDD
jgi:hypothetical protein